LLDERWISKKGRDAFTSGQMRMLGEYVEKLNLIQIDSLSPEVRNSTEERIGELEDLVEPEVVEILRARTTPGYTTEANKAVHRIAHPPGV